MNINETTLELILPFIELIALAKMATINKNFRALINTEKYSSDLRNFKKKHLKQIVEVINHHEIKYFIDRESRQAKKTNAVLSFEAFKERAEKQTLYYKFVCRNTGSSSATQEIDEYTDSFLERIPLDGTRISTQEIKTLDFNELEEIEKSTIRVTQETTILFLRNEITYLNRTMKQARDLRLIYLSNRDPILSHPNVSFFATKCTAPACTCTGPFADQFSYGPCFFSTPKEDAPRDEPTPQQPLQITPQNTN